MEPSVSNFVVMELDLEAMGSTDFVVRATAALEGCEISARIARSIEADNLRQVQLAQMAARNPWIMAEMAAQQAPTPDEFNAYKITRYSALEDIGQPRR